MPTDRRVVLALTVAACAAVALLGLGFLLDAWDRATA